MTTSNDNDTEKWRSLDLEAERRGVTPAWLREQCKLLDVPILGTSRTPLVSRVLIDAALDARAARAMAKTSEQQTMARAIATLPPKRARGA